MSSKRPHPQPIRKRLGAAVLALCIALPALPSLAAEPGPDGNRGHLYRLLHDPAVLAHLGLSEGQTRAAQAASGAVVEKHRPDFARALATEVRADRVAGVAKVFVAVNAETFDRLRPLIDADQHLRLQQIEIQTFGVRALLRPAVVERLTLTAAQRGALKAVGDGAGKRISDTQRSTTLAASDKAKLVADIRATSMQEAQAQLGAVQRVRWELLTGARYAR